MPLVLVGRNPDRVDDRFLQRLVRALPTIVSSNLTCNDPDGALARYDIEVKVSDFGPFDHHTKDVEIIIWANHCQSRLNNLGARRVEIVKDIKLVMDKWKFAPGTRPTGSVRVRLAPESYGEF